MQVGTGLLKSVSVLFVCVMLALSAVSPASAERSARAVLDDRDTEATLKPDPASYLLAVWTEKPLESLLVSTERRVLPRARAVRDSPYLTTEIPRLEESHDKQMRLQFPGDPGDVGEWGVYLLPGWEPADIVEKPRRWVRQQSIAFKEGWGQLPEDLTLKPEIPAPPDKPDEEIPEEELPAAERFANLPRFGMSLFRTEDEMRRVRLDEEERDSRDEGRRDGDDTNAGTVSGQAVPPSYIIGPGDELAVRVWTRAVEHVSVRSTVSTDGTVYLPLVGEVTVASSTLADVREMMNEMYHQYFDAVQVSVALARTRVIEVRVTGDARRPGKYRLSGAATVFTALYAAGGPSEIGSLRDIRLLRRAEPPQVVDMYDYLLEGDAGADVLLEPEDTIFIPPSGPMVGLSGEVQRPARYELTEGITIASALDMAGGFTGTGDARRVQVWRIGDDGQRRLINVDATDPDYADFALSSGDLMVVDPVLEEAHNIVQISGAVTRPGSYEFREGMTVGDLLDRARGVVPGAHAERAWIRRLSDGLKYEQMRFRLADALAGEADADIPLRARDQVVILHEEDVEAPSEVEVTGAVRSPGVLPWNEGMQLSDLIALAGGLTDDAHTARADLLRLTPEQKREIIPVKLGEAVAGEADADVKLARGDRLRVLDRGTVMVEAEIEVGGYVNTPGRHRRFEKMRVSDALIAAGGLAPEAGREIQHTPGGDRTEIAPVVLTLERDGDETRVEPDPILEDDDLVTVLGIGDMVGRPKSVTIRGRVTRPGTYAMETREREPDTVYDLLERAGGMLENANPHGIVLYRLRDEILAEEQSEDLAQMISTFNRELVEDTVEAQRMREEGMTGQVAEGLRAAFAQHDRAIIIPPRRLTQDAWARAVPIDGELMMETRGDEGNFDLVHGDILVVPETPNTVTVMGAVIRPGALAWRDALEAEDYIKHAGGYAPDAEIRRTVLIRANGAVEAEGLNAEIRPGDIVLVPSDYMIREIAKPSTLDRILSGISGILGAYLLFR